MKKIFVKAEIHEDLKRKVQHRAEQEGRSEASILVKALNKFLETPVKK